jgi:MFS family permease
MSSEGTTLARSKPVLVTSFVQRCGDVGVSLVPMLLVDLRVASTSASFILTAGKTAAVVGFLLGGLTADRLGTKFSLVASLFLAGSALLCLRATNQLVLFAVLVAAIQLFQKMAEVSMRLWVRQSVGEAQQREAFGWLRSTNNVGNLVAFGIAWIFSASGPRALLAFDGATSILAAIYGLRAFSLRLQESAQPTHANDAAVPEAAVAPRPDRPAWQDLWRLFRAALVCCLFMFLYESFMISAAARAKLTFPSEGVQLFAALMMINTVLCAVVAVPMSRLLKNPNIVFPAGVLLALLAVGISMQGASTRYFWASLLVMTFAEIVFMSMAMWVLLRLTPPGPHEGKLLSVAMVIQRSGMILAGAFVFPLLVNRTLPWTILPCVGALALVIWLSLMRSLQAIHQSAS